MARRNRTSTARVRTRYPVHPVPDAVEISSGGGLLAIAAAIEGIEVHVHCEIDKNAVKTLKHNFDPSISVCDIEKLEVDPPAHGLDLFIGGPPCQPWSSARSMGAEGARGADDPRNLWGHMTRLISELQPRVVMLENVVGILDKPFIPALGRPGQRIPGSWWEAVEDLGYEGVIYTITAADYGTPQNRQRVWMVCWPKGAPWGAKLRQPPPATHYDPRGGRPADPRMRPWTTAYSRLQGGCCQGYGLVTCRYLNNRNAECNGCVNGESYRLAPNEDGGGARLTPKQAAKAFEEWTPGSGVARIAKQKPFDAGGTLYDPLREGESRRAAVTGRHLAPTLTKALAKMPRARIATLEDTGRMDLACPVDEDAAKLRQVTVREAAKLQDVPQWYEFKGSQTSQYNQIGNGVAVNMGRAVLRHALQALRPNAPSPIPGTLAATAASRDDYTGLWPFGLGVTGCRSVVPISDEHRADRGYREHKSRAAARASFPGGDPNRERNVRAALVEALDELRHDGAFVNEDSEDEDWTWEDFAHLLPRYTRQGADYGVLDEDQIHDALRRAPGWGARRGSKGRAWRPA